MPAMVMCDLKKGIDMKLENLVTSLKLSRKLKEAGVPQKSIFYWVDFKDGDLQLVYGKDKCKNYNIDLTGTCSAYLAEELEEMLPWHDFDFRMSRKSISIYKARKIIDRPLESFGFSRETKTESIGEMLFWLIKKGYVKVEELK